MASATYLCVDIETSGPVPGLYDMISVGGVPVVPEGSRARVVGERTFYVEIRPQAPRFDARTVPIHGLSRSHLEAHGLPLARAMERLTAWTRAVTVPGTTPVFVGHNAPFDWSFISWSYHFVGQRNPFGYKALDTKALAMGALGLPWLDANKEELAERLALPEVETEQVHRADYDAWYQAHILARLLEAAGLVTARSRSEVP